MDFLKYVEEFNQKKNIIEIYPDWTVEPPKDLMARGGKFYAIWDEDKKMWSTNEFDVARLIDQKLYEYAKEKENSPKNVFGAKYVVKPLSNYGTNMWKKFKSYLDDLPDCSHDLDSMITFNNTETSKKDYVSKRLDYDLRPGNFDSYNKIMNTLYSPEERAKIEWAIGAVITGDSIKIQKFLVFYGEPGTGKSTVLNIIQKLFKSYYCIFEAKELASKNNQFSTDQFASNPLVAIQHDGDLSKIEDNTKLNSIVSHETILINGKYVRPFPMKSKCFMFMASNKPVKITDAKAGLIRRLIDVIPTGNKIPANEYDVLFNNIDYELGAIAWHCKEVYESMGPGYYNSYRPVDMMYKTDAFFNFVENFYFEFSNADGISLKQAYKMYKEYCTDTGAPYAMQMYLFREELKNYFKKFEPVKYIDNMQVRSWYSDFDTKKFDRKTEPVKKEKTQLPIILDSQNSLFDDICMECPAQYASSKETPKVSWDNCETILADIDTTKLHYVRVPENHIVLDFDLKDETGNKSLELNLKAASKYPPTYTETSKSGNGLHLHYIYNGDVNKLASVIDKGIEIKVFTGKSSLRRKLVKCNTLPVTTISSGLPLKKKGEVKNVDLRPIKDSAELKNRITRIVNKECEGVPSTISGITLINKILNEAYDAGVQYDLRSMKKGLLDYAFNSSNHSTECVKIVGQMKLCSVKEEMITDDSEEDGKPIVIFDTEVYPNYFLIVWKRLGKDSPPVKMINPTPEQVIDWIEHYRLVGYNCRRYDNHVIYACTIGYNNKQIYNVSKGIINGEEDCFFGPAWNLSYLDLYDCITKKQSLKKFEIEYGLPHIEMDLDWNQPVPEELWDRVADYCINDVVSTEEVYNRRQADVLARKILVSICQHAGVKACMNDTTNTLTTKIIFGSEKKPELIYTHLESGKTEPAGYERNDILNSFPGYEFKDGKNMYMGEDVGFGGYVYAEPGMYGNVALLDVASMHPHSILAMDCFGKYTKRFEEIVQARILIKHKEFDKAKEFLDGALAPYLNDEEQADALATALKIPINSVYGLTSARFDNPFRDKRNKNNIVALRGALMMVKLKHEVQARGFTVAHIKTDSIKIPDATPEIIQFVMDFGKQYGYTFEHEATYEKMCLVNNAVYIAKYKDGKHAGEWTATGTQFQVPYVFKKLFSNEPIEFEDLCETKSVTKGELYLDFNEDLPEDKHNYVFVGRVGSFCPIKPKCGGGLLYRCADEKYYAATGTIGYRWKESTMVKETNSQEDVDISYYDKLAEEAAMAISEHGNFEWFISDKPYEAPPFAGGKIV